MDQTVLVSTGHALVKALDKADLAPRLAMWVHTPDTDSWKLWIVPPKEGMDRFEFYRRIAEVVAKNRAALGDLSASDIELASETHPAVIGISQFAYVEGLSAVGFSGNRFNNYYLPDGIILRSQFERRSKPRA